MYVCMCVCMYVCMYVCECKYINPSLFCFICSNAACGDSEYNMWLMLFFVLFFCSFFVV